jgi:peptide/nickel transport system substrate-binding protein
MHVNLVYTGQAASYSDSFILPDDSAAGLYTVYVSATKSGFTTGQSQSTFTVQVGSLTTSTTSTTTGPSQKLCLIATAAYGSELSPEVSMLRNFRDQEILHTKAGASFMQAFNAFYYSFSPQIASIISSSNDIRIVTKAALYPLVGILYMASFIFAAMSFNGELAVVVSGAMAAFGLGFVYVGSIASLVAPRLQLARSSSLLRAIRTSCILPLMFLILLLVGEAASVSSVLTVAAVGIVLSFMALGSLLPLWIARRN